MNPEQATLLYPRLPDGVARAIVSGWDRSDLLGLRNSASLQHHSAAPSATGGHAADIDDVLRVQKAVRSVADNFSFPAPLGQSAQQQFDQACGAALFESMRIVPADAASRGVWTFLTVVVLPEVAEWRFPNAPLERVLGDRRRNVLRRLWWRSWTLDSPDTMPAGCTPLGEDELVQIMERPGLSGDARVGRALQAAVWKIEKKHPTAPRSRVFRQVCLHLLARKSHVLLASLTDQQLADAVDDAIVKAVARI